AAVVQEPLRLDPRLHHAVGEAIGLEVIGLRVVHGEQEGLSGGWADGRMEAEQIGTDRQTARPPDRLHELSSPHDLGIAPFARSSARRASGTRALPGYERMRCSRCWIASAVCCR